MRPVILEMTALAVLLTASTAVLAQTDTPPAAPAPAPAATTPAGAATADGAPAQNPAPDGTAVTGAAAWDLIKGNTLSGKTGGDAFSEFIAPDGGVKYVDKDGLSTGTWTVQGKKICLDFPDDDDRSCSVFTVNGTKGYAIDDDGQTTRFEVLPGNPKGL